MGDHPETRHFEPRWPAGLTILAVIALLGLLPGRVRLAPQWLTYVLGLLILAPMTAAGMTRGRADLLRAERFGTLAFFTIATVSTLLNLVNLIREILDPSSAIGGIELLASSIAIWVTNVLSFSLMYWQLDRGGPDARLDAHAATPDWQFPQEALADIMPHDWRPAFVDYLFLGFCTATAFSPTGALPLRSRAMLLMMLESSISLITIAVVAARSINILGA